MSLSLLNEVNHGNHQVQHAHAQYKSEIESIQVQRVAKLFALEETQKASHSREIVNPRAESKEELHTMIIAEKIGHAPAKEGSGEFEKLGRLERTVPDLAELGLQRGQGC